MGTMQTYEKIFANAEKLTALICGILGLSWNDETYSLMVDDSPMEWTDHEAIHLPNEVELDEDSIDGVLIFGDGTIEFHLKNEQDAINWAKFSEEVVEKVIGQLGLVWNECCNK